MEEIDFKKILDDYSNRSTNSLFCLSIEKKGKTPFVIIKNLNSDFVREIECESMFQANTMVGYLFDMSVSLIAESVYDSIKKPQDPPGFSHGVID